MNKSSDLGTLLEEKDPRSVSVIIPFVGEYPQVLFTIQAVAQELIDTDIPFEIIAVDNYCEEVVEQARFSMERIYSSLLTRLKNQKVNNPADMVNKNLPDFQHAHKNTYVMYENKSGEAVKAASALNPWLKYMTVPDTLSHWECKRRACMEAKYNNFLFLDAHTIPAKGSIFNMLSDYVLNKMDYDKKGTFHMPLTYKILESRRLIYKMKIEKDFYGYVFTRYSNCSGIAYEVPCMSTCGMLISREVYNRVGGWPSGMTMYGGGENFMNYTLSVLGLKKFIFPGATLFHHGEKRDYHYTYDGMIFNRMIAHYLFGGLSGLKKYTEGLPGNIERGKKINFINQIIDEQSDHRSFIRDQQKIGIEEWAKKW